MSSEVVKLRQQLDEICVSMQRGLYGYACVSRHTFVTHKYEQIGKIQEELTPHVGKEQAFQEVLDALQRSETELFVIMEKETPQTHASS